MEARSKLVIITLKRDQNKKWVHLNNIIIASLLYKSIEALYRGEV